MQSSESDVQSNQFLNNNPQKDQASPSKKIPINKSILNKKRKLIQKQLRQLMSKVDQYQLEKDLVTKIDTQEVVQLKKQNGKNQDSSSQFDQADIVKRRPITKQLLKEHRYKTKTPRIASDQLSERSKERSHSSKSKQLPVIDDKSRLRQSQQRQKYINYLPDVDFRVPLPNKGSNAEKKKQKLINYLEKAQEYEKDAIKKIGQIKRGKANLNYMEYIQVENQVDAIYVNSLKARIQCAMKM